MQWKDNQNRPWNCRLTIADVKRLKANGCDIANPESFQKLFADTLGFVEIVAESLRPQWEQAGLKYEEFAELIVETTGRLQEVQKAFIDGLKDFFHRLGDKAMATVVEKAASAVSQSNKAREARANSPKIDSLVQKVLAKDENDFEKILAEQEAKLSGDRSTSAPASSV